MSWTMPPPRWGTLAGRVLDTFFEAVHRALPDYQQPLTIFGSAPIQLCLDESFASADVDIAHHRRLLPDGRAGFDHDRLDHQMATAAEVGEEEHLYVPPSGALAGKIYNTLMSQVTAGKKHGSLNEVDAVAFDLRKSEVASLEKMGLVPMVNEYGKVMAFSAKTLFNGDNIGLQTYSVVRVFDYISKVLMDFLNRRAFENFNSKTQREIRSQIVKFLDGVCGPGKLIEKFQILRFEQDPNQKDRIYLDIHMTPYFPAKNYVFKLDGQKGDDPDSAEWQSEYAQE